MTTSADRVAKYRATRIALGLEDTTKRNSALRAKLFRERHEGSLKPFIGCDGEGAGTDTLGRQRYMLFCMGERELYTGAPLNTTEILNFICDHPTGEILVGFAFGYDVTMILHDLSEQQCKRLFEPKTFGEGHSPYVWYKQFNVDYLHKQYFKVCRVTITRDAEGKEKRTVIKGSTRIIYETFGFFQKSFLKVLQEFDVGTPGERELIRVSKEQRGSTDWNISDVEREYCKLECRCLAELMEKLRGYCHDAGIRPSTWNGAGKLAASLHRTNATLRSKAVAEYVPPEVLSLANMAYYGGRFEITRTGKINGAVYEHDIRSAYPAAMRELPCLVHGEWQEQTPAELRTNSGLFISIVRWKPAKVFEHGQLSGLLAGLPIRSKAGHLYWPTIGSGVYWSPEIRSAESNGYDVSYIKGYSYRKMCDCQPFAWVEDLFNYRRSIGAGGPGYPIKLGINSLYGKLAQRKGRGQYNNLVWSGLITAIIRAKLNDAVRLAGPANTIMIATDAVYTDRPLDLDIGENLGQWERTELPGLFIVQPGLYWSPELAKKKSRGISAKFFEQHERIQEFYNAWHYFKAHDRDGNNLGFPAVDIPFNSFIGLRLALARNKPELAGTWIKDKRSFSFDYRNKRSHHVWRDDCIITEPKLGSSGLASLPHRDFLAAGGDEPWEGVRMLLDDQPDYVDLSSPFMEQ